MTRSRKAAAIGAAIALFTAAPGAQADIAPPQLDGCRVRPLGSPCFVDGETRGVCAEQVHTFPNGNEYRQVVCRVAAPGVDPGAPASSASVAPATSASVAPAPSAAAPASAAPPQASSCAAGQGGDRAARGLAAAMIAAALMIAASARRRASRRQGY